MNEFLKVAVSLNRSQTHFEQSRNELRMLVHCECISRNLGVMDDRSLISWSKITTSAAATIYKCMSCVC
jgi:hypothetical protein